LRAYRWDVAEGEHRVQWNDPLLPTTRPTGTGSGSYVMHPEPRPNQYTIEGEIAMVGEFASGATRARGWRGALARGLVLWWLLGFAAAIGLTLFSIVR